MAPLKDSKNFAKAVAVGRSPGVLDTNPAGNVNSNGCPLDGSEVVASAAALPVPTTRVVSITGAVAITSIASGGSDGQEVTYIFASTPTFTDGGNLKLSANLVATADDTISLICLGDNWYETGRAVN